MSLLQLSDLTYLGAFLLPSGDTAGHDFAYAGSSLLFPGALGFDPAGDAGRGSLFVAGNISQGTAGRGPLVAEVNIPAPVISGSFSALNRAAYLQNFGDVGNANSATNPGSTVNGSFDLSGYNHASYLIYNGGLIWTGYGTYGDPIQWAFARSNMNLSTNPNGSGPWKTTLSAAGTYSGESQGGMIGAIPANWQSTFTKDGTNPATHYAGTLCGPSVTGRFSQGPGMVCFSAADVGVAANVPTKTYLFYPTTDPTTLARCDLTAGGPAGTVNVWDFATAAANYGGPGFFSSAVGTFFVDNGTKRGIAFLVNMPFVASWYGQPSFYSWYYGAYAANWVRNPVSGYPGPGQPWVGQWSATFGGSQGNPGGGLPDSFPPLLPGKSQPAGFQQVDNSTVATFPILAGSLPPYAPGDSHDQYFCANSQDPTRDSSGNECALGMRPELWVYDPQSLAAWVNGGGSTWTYNGGKPDAAYYLDQTPANAWIYSGVGALSSKNNGSNSFGGSCYDPVGKKLYVSQPYNDTYTQAEGPGSGQPMIHVYGLAL